MGRFVLPSIYGGHPKFTVSLCRRRYIACIEVLRGNAIMEIDAFHHWAILRSFIFLLMVALFAGFALVAGWWTRRRSGRGCV